jgi:hypothetical protein
MTLVAGAFIFLNLSTRWRSGSTHIGFPFPEAFTDHYPWIDNWLAFLVDMAIFYGALRASVSATEYLIRRREPRRDD